jgi:hypothetical protein
MKTKYILIVLALLMTAAFMSTKINLPGCTQLHYEQNTTCQVGNYSASNYYLSGNLLPQNNSLDGKFFHISGNLDNIENCSIINVTKLKPCK